MSDELRYELLFSSTNTSIYAPRAAQLIALVPICSPSYSDRVSIDIDNGGYIGQHW